MPKRKQLMLAAAIAGALLLLVHFIPAGSGPEALAVTVLGSTNGLSGSPMSLVSVTNNTGQARRFAFAAEVSTPTGWTDRRGWVERHYGGLTQLIAAHSACQLLLPGPEGAAKWRFRCHSWVEVGKVEWNWYLLVRRTGLGRMGFRDQPRASLAWTTEVTQ